MHNQKQVLKMMVEGLEKGKVWPSIARSVDIMFPLQTGLLPERG